MDRDELRSLIQRQLKNADMDYLEWFADYVLDRAPGSFWLAPASSTGKYHPEDECRPGGTALHTARVIRVATDLAEMDGLDMKNRSNLVLAALLHDMWKGGEGDTPTEHTWKLHSVAPRAYVPRWYDEWRKVYLDFRAGRELIPEDIRDDKKAAHRLDLILRAVEAHEGRWSLLPISAIDRYYGGEIGRLLHIADYIASRRYISIQLD